MHNTKDTGFSLIELIVVMLLVGILAGIAVPSWLAFINRQEVNKANDAVFAALQEAQREAKKKKLNYSVSFQKNSTTKNAAPRQHTVITTTTILLACLVKLYNTTRNFTGLYAGLYAGK